MRRVRVALLAAAAAALVPACGGDGHGGGSMALFSDAFDRTTAGSDWHVVSSGGTVVIDATRGNPAPALGISVNQSGREASVHTETSFTARPLTASVDVGLATAGAGAGGVEIVNGSHAPLASVEWSAVAGGELKFTIGATTQTVPPSSLPSGILTLRFNVDSLGNAAWSAGDTMVLTAPGFPPVPVSVMLFTRSDTTLPGGSFPLFLFDNVSVTSP